MSAHRSILRRLTILLVILSLLAPGFYFSTLEEVAAAQTIVDSTSPLLAKNPQTGWGTQSDINAYNGSVLYTSDPGASVSYTFSGGSTITYLYTMAINRGAVIVTIDNEIVDILDGRAVDTRDDLITPTHRRQTAKTYPLSGTGQHTIRIEAKPGEGPIDRAYMDLDAFIVDINKGTLDPLQQNKTFDQTNANAEFFGPWYSWYTSEAYNGYYRYSIDPGAGVRFTFIGDYVTWYFTKATNRGMAIVTIDGENQNVVYDIVDLYYSSTVRTFKTFSGLGDGVHTMTIINLGANHPASTGFFVDADRFVIGNGDSTLYNRLAAANYADRWVHAINPDYMYIPENDCTNFSSQAIHAGGIPYLHDASYHDWPEYWWHRTVGTVKSGSLTWRNAPDFLNHTAAEQDPNTDFLVSQHLSFFLALRKGDLIVLDDKIGLYPGHDGIPDHIRVLAGGGYTSPFYIDYNGGESLVSSPQLEMLIDQHSTDRWHVPWDYKLLDMPEDILVLIKVLRN